MTTNVFFYFLSLTRYSVSVILPFFSVIEDWSVSAPFSHLANGMMYDDGRYYIYLQVYCITQGRVYVRANNRVITMIQSPTSSGTLYAGGVFNLTAGDVITFFFCLC